MWVVTFTVSRSWAPHTKDVWTFQQLPCRITFKCLNSTMSVPLLRKFHTIYFSVETSSHFLPLHSIHSAFALFFIRGNVDGITSTYMNDMQDVLYDYSLLFFGFNKNRNNALDRIYYSTTVILRLVRISGKICGIRRISIFPSIYRCKQHN